MSFHIKPYFLVRITIAGVMAMIFAITPVFNIRQADAAIPQTINYQSRLMTPGGLAVTSTTAIQLSFYLHPTNGAPGDAPAEAGPLVWKEVYDQGSGACSMVTPDSKGYFFLKLGSCAPFPSYLDFSDIMYVGVKIGADAEASPRVQLSSHPYALNAYRLNGYEATSTATANQLLALDSNLNFNIATGTFTGAGLFINGTSTLQQVTFTVATGTSLNLTQYLAIGAIRLDSVGSNNQTSGAYLVGVFDEFTNSNATTVQAALFDLDTAITTVSSTLYAMDLQQVTDNGNTTTNSIQFAGGTSTGQFIVNTRLGIGTNNPTRALDILSDSPIQTVWRNSAGEGVMIVSDNLGDEIGLSDIRTDGFIAAVSKADPTLYYYARGLLNANFNTYSVGINTTAPSSMLDIVGGATGAAILTLNSDDGMAFGRDAGIVINSDNNNGSDAAYLIFRNNGVQSAKFFGGSSSSGFDLAASTTYGITQDGFVRLHMTDMGNFGFATDTPAYRVDVLGDARLSAQLMLGQYAVNPAVGNQAGAMIYNTADLVPYYWDGTQWIAFATGTAAEMDTLQTVTDRGASTTNPIVFAGGTSTASLEVTGELSINGIRLSASGTNPLVSGAYLVGTFDEFANFNATSVQAALKAIDSMLTFGSASTSVFVGLTAGSYDGAFSYGGKVGYQAANDICLNEYPGSHFCRTDEIIATVASVDISALFAAMTYGWIAEGPPGYTANSNDCAGYTSNSNTSLGAFWAYDPNGGGMGWLNNCEVTRKISCCR